MLLLKEFPQHLPTELLATDDSGRGKSLSSVMYPLVSVPDSSGWLQVHHHTEGPGSTLSHKTKLKEWTWKGAYRKKEESLRVGNNSERWRDESHQNALYSWIKWTKKHLVNNKFICLALIEVSFCSKYCSRLGGFWTWAELALKLRRSHVYSNLTYTRATTCFSHTTTQWVHFLCCVLLWLFQKPFSLQLKASPLHWATSSSCCPLLDSGGFPTTFPILRSSSDKDLNHRNLWLVTLRWLCLGNGKTFDRVDGTEDRTRQQGDFPLTNTIE